VGADLKAGHETAKLMQSANVKQPHEITVHEYSFSIRLYTYINYIAISFLQIFIFFPEQFIYLMLGT
jgi:hypothetical protein